MHKRLPALSLVFALLALSSAAPRAEAPKLESVRKIWDAAPHNAFTDLIRFKDAWYCAFREGAGHVSPDGKLRVIRSKDGQEWKSAALISDERGDLRDAKLTVTPSGKLMLLGAVAYPKGNKHSHQSLAWFSDDGTEWNEAVDVADPNVWLWRVTWNDDHCLGIGYSTSKDRFIRLYKSSDGKDFKTVVPKLSPTDYPNESSILFEKDGTALCLLRRDPANGLFGRSEPPYTDWDWQDVGMRIGGPALIELPDGRLIGAVRLYDNNVRTSLVELDRATGKAKEILSFPSGGDTSYPGLVWHDGRLWMSYYSSHEGKTSIYLATITL